jgi:hypothetical protein
MQDESWLSKLTICGQVERTWESLYEVRGGGDDVSDRHASTHRRKVLDVVCLLFLVTLHEAGASLGIALQHSAQSMVEILTSMLRDRVDILRPESGTKITASVSNTPMQQADTV